MKLKKLFACAVFGSTAIGLGCAGDVSSTNGLGPDGVYGDAGLSPSDPDSVADVKADVAAETEEPVDHAALINEYIDVIDYLPVAEETQSANWESPEEQDGDYVCQTVNFTETQQYDKIVAYSANSETLWPGAVVRGESVYSGLFTQVVLPRAPLTFSVSHRGLDGHVSATLEEPSLSSFREALTGILDASVIAHTEADMSIEIEEVHSEEQLNLALGVGGSYAGAELDLSFNFSNSHVRSRHVVRYYQKYFTVDIDQPSQASNFFADSVTLDQVQAVLPPGDDPPTYVSSITFGRMILFTIESEYSAEEIGAALDFAYSGTGYDVYANFSVGYKQMIDESNITAYVLGGSADEAAQALSVGSYEALVNLIGSGGNFSAESPGAPIAYKLAYLKDNAPARFSLTTDYDLRECYRINQGVLVTLKSIEVESPGSDAGSAIELYGYVGAWGSDGSEAVLWETDDEEWKRIEENDYWPHGGIIEEAIVNAEPTMGSEIIIEVRLRESDDWPNGDDSFGTKQLILPFEEGWRNESLVMRLTSGGMVVNLHFSIRPI